MTNTTTIDAEHGGLALPPISFFEGGSAQDMNSWLGSFGDLAFLNDDTSFDLGGPLSKGFSSQALASSKGKSYLALMELQKGSFSQGFVPPVAGSVTESAPGISPPLSVAFSTPTASFCTDSPAQSWTAPSPSSSLNSQIQLSAEATDSQQSYLAKATSKVTTTSTMPVLTPSAYPPASWGMTLPPPTDNLYWISQCETAIQMGQLDFAERCAEYIPCPHQRSAVWQQLLSATLCPPASKGTPVPVDAVKAASYLLKMQPVGYSGINPEQLANMIQAGPTPAHRRQLCMALPSVLEVLEVALGHWKDLTARTVLAVHHLLMSRSDPVEAVLVCSSAAAHRLQAATSEADPALRSALFCIDSWAYNPECLNLLVCSLVQKRYLSVVGEFAWRAGKGYQGMMKLWANAANFAEQSGNARVAEQCRQCGKHCMAALAGALGKL